MTASKFIANPYSRSGQSDRLYRTGDRCRWLSDGSIEYLGRIDSQVKLRGFRIELEEIEHRILESDGVRSCAVVLRHRQSDGRDPFLCAYLVSDPGHPAINLAAVHRSLSESLPNYMIPAAFVMLHEIPRDRAGKTDRKKLPEPEPQDFVLRERIDRSSNDNELSQLQHQVRDAFAAILGIDSSQLALDDHFFQLGGQSLMAARLLALIRQRFSTRIGFAEFFAEPTIAYVAQRVSAAESTDDDVDLVPRDDSQWSELPLSSAQRRMLFLHQLDPKSSLYNVCAVYELRGSDLDVARLSDALRTVVQRHEILRSSYENRSDEIVQIVNRESDFALRFRDLSEIPDEAQRRSKAERETSTACLAPFDLGTVGSSPCRALLMRLSPNVHRLVIAAHHIAVDGLSWEVLCDEVSTIYAANSPAQLPIQYGDFCVWEGKFVNTREYRRQLTYWQKRLGHDPEPLDLPTDRPRPDVQTDNGASYVHVGKKLGTLLRQFSQTQDVTPFTLLLAAYNVLLFRHSGQEDLIVGVLSSGRSQADTDSLIGLFVNTLPVKNTVRPEMSFLGLLDQVKTNTLEAFDHQDVPFDEITKNAIVHSRDPTRMPLVQTMLTLDDGTATSGSQSSGLRLQGLEVHELELEASTTSMFDFSIGCTLEEGGDLFLDAEYNRDLFEASTVARMLSHFEQILREVLSDPSQRVATVPLMTRLSEMKSWHSAVQSGITPAPARSRRSSSSKPPVIPLRSRWKTPTGRAA